MPDPVAALRAASKRLRPRGIVAFQEVSYAPSLAVTNDLPLWSACTIAARTAMIRKGANPEIGSALHRLFIEAGLPQPTTTVEMQLGVRPELVLWPYYLLTSLSGGEGRALPAELGDIGTLPDRLQDEVARTGSAAASSAVVSAWTRLA